MKFSLQIIKIFLFTILFSFSCERNNHAIDLLKQAKNELSTDPAYTITLLDSIKDPERMGQDYYMQYIVACVQTKYNRQLDVSNDTLIFEAQKYFNYKDDIQEAAIANFYAGTVYRLNKKNEQALKSFLLSQRYSQQIKDTVLTAKSLHFLGNLYLEQGMMDSAITHYKEALSYYNIDPKVVLNKLQVISLIGRSYEAINNLDSAYYYFNKGLDYANQTDNKEYQAKQAHNLGFIYLRMGKYDKAEDYLVKALEQSDNAEDSLKIYLNLSLLYNKTNQLELAKHYNDLIQSRLPNIKDNHILESLYGALADYNRQKGDYKEALHYRDLQADINLEIAKQNKAEELFAAEKRYEFFLEKKETSNLRMRSYLYVSISVFLVILIVSITYFRSRHTRLKHNKEKELLEKKLENYEFVQNVYTDIINQWTKLERQAKALTIKYIKDEDPLIYGEMRAFMNYLSSMSNIKFIESSKDFLREQPNGDKAVEIMDETELLLLMLLYNKYNEEEISNILGQVLVNQKSIHDRKSDIITKLEKAGISNTFIEKIFPKR